MREYDKEKKYYMNYPIKEHDINIESLYKLSSLGKVYIFSNNDTEYNDKRVIRITKKDLMKFIRKKIYIMPDKIKILFGENM